MTENGTRAPPVLQHLGIWAKPGHIVLKLGLHKKFKVREDNKIGYKNLGKPRSCVGLLVPVSVSAVAATGVSTSLLAPSHASCGYGCHNGVQRDGVASDSVGGGDGFRPPVCSHKSVESLEDFPQV